MDMWNIQYLMDLGNYFTCRVRLSKGNKSVCFKLSTKITTSILLYWFKGPTTSINVWIRWRHHKLDLCLSKPCCSKVTISSEKKKPSKGTKMDVKRSAPKSQLCDLGVKSGKSRWQINCTQYSSHRREGSLLQMKKKEKKKKIPPQFKDNTERSNMSYHLCAGKKSQDSSWSPNSSLCPNTIAQPASDQAHHLLTWISGCRAQRLIRPTSVPIPQAFYSQTSG